MYIIRTPPSLPLPLPLFLFWCPPAGAHIIMVCIPIMVVMVIDIPIADCLL